MKLTKLFLLLASISALVISSDGSALAAGGTLAVQATVIKSCTMTSTAVSFAAYDPLAIAADSTGTGTISIKCGKGTGVNVGLDLGANSGGGTQAKMSDGATIPTYLNYALFQDTDRSLSWGNVSGSWKTVDPDTNPTLTVYGKIPALQNVPAGTGYTDTVQVSFNF